MYVRYIASQVRYKANVAHENYAQESVILLPRNDSASSKMFLIKQDPLPVDYLKHLQMFQANRERNK